MLQTIPDEVNEVPDELVQKEVQPEPVKLTLDWADGLEVVSLVLLCYISILLFNKSCILFL